MKRHWDFANIKRSAEYDRCRICTESPTEMAHTTSCRYDDRLPNGDYMVDPASVVPLCKTHHDLVDEHQFDLLPFLSRDEEVDAVKRVGIDRAFRRLCPSLYAEVAAP
jgi:hypothetical protein